MTLLTDYALCALSLVLASRIRSRGHPAASKYWMQALLSAGIAAFIGGTYHGFLPYLPAAAASGLWKGTLFSIGWAAYQAELATIHTHLSSASRKVLNVVFVAQLGVYCVSITLSDAFLVAIVNYSIAFLFVLVVHLWRWLAGQDLAARWIVAGIVTTFAGAGIQAAGLSPHQHFNHNDLFHVVQMLGTWLLYRGAALTKAPNG